MSIAEQDKLTKDLEIMYDPLQDDLSIKAIMRFKRDYQKNLQEV